MKGHTLKKLYIGMDVHKSSISVAIALPGKEEAIFYGKVSGSSPNVERILIA